MRGLMLTLVLLVASPLRASADAIGLFIHETQFNPGETEVVASAMAAAVEGQGDTVVWLTDPEDIRTANQALESSCPLDCFTHLAAALGVQGVFAASVWRVDEGASIGMDYRAHNRRHSISAVVGNFAAGTVLERVRTAHHQLLRWDQGHAPVLRVVTDPPGAAVVARGQPLGMTPLEVPMPPGAITLMISLRGHQPVRHTVTVPLEDEANVELTLAPVHSDDVAAPSHRSVVPGIVLAAAGGLGLASSAAALAVERCIEVDAGGRCHERRQANVGAAAGCAAAASIALVGGVIWAIRARNHNERSAEVRVGLGSMEVQGRF